MFVDEPSKPWSAGGSSTSLRDPFTIFNQPLPYSEWADRWEKENLAGSDFPVILNVNQWHLVDVSCVGYQLASQVCKLAAVPSGIPLQVGDHAQRTRDSPEPCRVTDVL